jgi:hypothetical protein
VNLSAAHARWIVAAFLAWLGGSGAVPSTAAEPRALVGAGACTSSGCHAAPVEGHEAWQSSYTVWATLDPHARAHRVLFDPLAARIVAALATRDPAMAAVPAPENRACVGCHATAGGEFAATGVSCESCHGPARDWLVAHTLPGWKTRGNTLGMVDLADPTTCGLQCAGCHVGGPPTADGSVREVSHDLIAAGHPRLAFELRSSKAAEPPHWRDRLRNSGSDAFVDPLDEWALGRAATLRAFLEQTLRQVEEARGVSGPAGGSAPLARVWPEFTAFDCYGCHRPAIAAVDAAGAVGAAATRRPSRGMPRLEPLQWSLLDVALPADAAGSLAAFRADVEAAWWIPPTPSAIRDALAVLDGARPRIRGSLAANPASVARRVAAAADAASWDEAAAGLAALEAVRDHAVVRGADAAAVAAATEALTALRRQLEFDGVASGPRFDSPRGYDPAAVATAIEEAAAAVAIATARDE